MNWMGEVWRRVGMLLRGKEFARELEEEFALHREMKERELRKVLESEVNTNRTEEAREWSQRILAKKPTMPGYLRRRERPWFRRANGLLKRLAA